MKIWWPSGQEFVLWISEFLDEIPLDAEDRKEKCVVADVAVKSINCLKNLYSAKKLESCLHLSMNSMYSQFLVFNTLINDYEETIPFNACADKDRLIQVLHTHVDRFIEDSLKNSQSEEKQMKRKGKEKRLL